MLANRINLFLLFASFLSIIYLLVGCTPSPPPWPKRPIITTTVAGTTTTVPTDSDKYGHKVGVGRYGKYKTIVEYTRFPWPPPEPSARVEIPNNFFQSDGKDPLLLYDIVDKLKKSLDYAGYHEKSFHPIPDGFVIVTRIERFNVDGSNKPQPDRWNIKYMPHKSFSIRSYLKKLLTANPGYYRIFVFIVTPHKFSPLNRHITKEEGLNWFSFGTNKIPWTIGNYPFTKDYKCLGYTYEFIKSSQESEVTLNTPGMITGMMHLEKANIWNELKGGY